MNLSQFISQRIQYYGFAARVKPTLITMHPKDVDILIQENLEDFVNKTLTKPYKIEFEGVRIVSSEDLKQGEIIFSTELVKAPKPSLTINH